MKSLGGSLWARTLCLIVVLCFSPFSYSVNLTDKQKEEDLRFWEEWNAFITELIRREFEAPDPWEPLNRKVFAFNDFTDRYALTPAAKAYQWITPDPLERGIGNMFANVREVTTILNGLLQFKFVQAASDTGRLLINTTVGLLGLFDVASAVGLEKHNEDFGQTLGYWGVGPGPYVVLPLLGSYTLRDSLGLYADTYVDYIRNIEHIPTRNQIGVTRVLHDRAGLFTAEQLITGDRYTFIRDAYLQRRAYLVNDGVLEDSFGDEDFEDDWGDEWEEE